MIKLIKIKEYKDGSADYRFEYDQDFVKFYKKETGESKIDDKKIGEFIREKLVDAVGDLKLEKSTRNKSLLKKKRTKR